MALYIHFQHFDFDDLAGLNHIVRVFHELVRQRRHMHEAILMHAVARLVLHPYITNIQTSWVKMGVDGAKQCLDAGANDLGGTLMNESISRAAGTQHGQEFAPAQMRELIRSLGRVDAQRTTLYSTPPDERITASFAALPLTEVRLGAIPKLKKKKLESHV